MVRSSICPVSMSCSAAASSASPPSSICVTRSDSPWFFGRYGFVLADVRPVPFFPVKGALGFFKWRSKLDG